MKPVLVVGYGNPSRSDDGVGLAVVNQLRQKLDLPLLTETDDGFDDLGNDLDTLFLQQITPELAETLARYGRVVFIDAHLGIYPESIRRSALQPQVDPPMVSHHMKPGTLLALAEQFYGGAPDAELISIRGLDFDFGSTLSPATGEAVAAVAEELWQRFGPMGLAGSCTDCANDDAGH